ncbi:MAG: hypothetical protein ACLP7A_07525 [Desulfobaccales bacterium]
MFCKTYPTQLFDPMGSDLSAIFYNPAGLVQLPGTQVMGGFSTFFPHADIATYGGPSETLTGLETGPTFVPHLFASHQFTERLWLGLGINSPFGLGGQVSRQLAR